MSCTEPVVWAASACAVLILSACQVEPGTGDPIGLDHRPTMESVRGDGSALEGSGPLSTLRGSAGAPGAAPLSRRNLRAADAPIGRWPNSFVRDPFVHPRIIQDLAEDLATSLSRVGDQVVAINLLDAQGSNRYSGSIRAYESDERCPYVYWEPPGERGEFGYRYVGMTESRVHVLYTSSWGGGSGVFNGLMLLAITSVAGIDWNEQDVVVQDERERLLVSKLGQLALGDRWDGDLRVVGNTLTIGPDRGWFSVSGGTGGGGRDYERPFGIDVGRSGALDFGAPDYTCAAVSGVQP